MSFAVAKTIATALVSSRLDYCNSLYHNIALKDISKLQHVQHCLARVVTLSPHFSHSAPLLKSLNWLPVRHHIIFKICTITYQALSSKQPSFLHSLLTPAKQPRQLRSSNYNLLFVPSVKTNVGTRAFSVAAPTLWNSLPVCVKSVATFRRKLKTHLHSSPTYQSKCLQLELLIDYKLINPFCFGVVPSLGILYINIILYNKALSKTEEYKNNNMYDMYICLMIDADASP